MVAPEVEGDGGDGGDGAKPRPQAPEFIFLCKTGWLRVREEGARPGSRRGEGSWEDRFVVLCGIELHLYAPQPAGKQTAKR